MASIFADPTGESQTKNLLRRSSVGSPLTPTRSAGSLVASAGAESASKARQLRHAATFSLRYNDPDSSEGSLAVLLRRHLQTQHGESVNKGDSDPSLQQEAPSASPAKKLSAKMERALQLRDSCERNLTKYCEAKHHTHPLGVSPISSPSRPDLLDKSYWFDPENVHDNHAQDKRAFDRLMRKLSPAVRNAATTHGDLVHSLQSCSECATRATFCARCARKASEFFENYSETELQTLYGSDLPAPDAKALAAFQDAMTEREYHATH